MNALYISGSSGFLPPSSTMAKVHPNTAGVTASEPQTLPARCCAAMALTVWRKSLLYGCRGFTVFDAKGNLVFRVDVYGSSAAGTLVLMDAAGKPLLTARRKKLSLGENWLIFNEEDVANPIYSVKRHVGLLQSQSKVIAHVTPCRRGGAGGGVSAGYEVEGSYTRRSCVLYDERRQAVAEIQRKEAVGGVAFGGDVFRLVVQTDVDACLAMAILIVLDQMFG